MLILDLVSSKGMISVLFTYPLEILRVRMAFQTRAPNSRLPSCSSAFYQIYHEHGSCPAPHAAKSVLDRWPLLKFYRGFTVTIAGMIPYAGMSFLTWDFLRARYLPPPPQDSSSSPPHGTPLADLAIGATSGALAQTVSYPFEVVRRRMQVGGLTQPDRWLHWGETVREVWRVRGWRGFYVGLGIGYLKVVPMTAVSFAVWQGGKRVLGV
jgi:solute carrier family 25 (mitochondrial carrier protein), member 16